MTKLLIVSDNGESKELDPCEPGQIVYLNPGQRVVHMVDDLPDCSDPKYDKWPNYICAMLADIKRYRFRMSDPEGYRKAMAEIAEGANAKKIKGAPKT